MKKKILYSSALAALLSASSIALAGGPEIIPIEDYFSGFYVGGMGGVHHVDFDASSSVGVLSDATVSSTGVLTPPEFIFSQFMTLSPGQTLITNDVDGASIDGYGGIQGGFGWTFNHVWYVGVQGFGEWGTQNSTQSTVTPIESTITFPPEGPSSFEETVSVDTSTKTTIKNDYGVAAKLGYVVAPRTLVYGKIGASWATVKVSNSADVVQSLVTASFNQITNVGTFNESGSSEASKTKVGLLLGIGAEQFVYQDIISVNIEYNYVNYGTVSTSAQLSATETTFLATGSGSTIVSDEVNNTSTALTTQASTNATVNSFLAGINFYFGRNWF